MRLISLNSELESTLIRLVRTYPHNSFAVAWASSETSVFDTLVAEPARIHRAVVGTHFYQTHPGVLDAFVNAPNVRFIMQPSGVFHPKVFAFWSETDWEVIVGSANLTLGALKANSEAVLLVRGQIEPGMNLFRQVTALIDDYWSQAMGIDEHRASAYRRIWQQQQATLRRLSGQYGSKMPSKPPVSSSIMTMSWDEFFERVKADPYHGYEGRCQLLRGVRAAFERHALFAKMDDPTRKTIAGIPGGGDDRWPWFGSMKGAGYFGQAIRRNDPHIAAGVDLMPLHGQVQRTDYDAFLSEFKLAFPKGGHGVAVATRLLALKRPDQFVCLDSKNQQSLCKDFGVTSSTMDYEKYWDDVVERIRDTPWWKASRPQDAEQQAVFDGRAAMLDAIFYVE